MPTISRVPRDPNITPEMRRFLDDLSRQPSSIFAGLDATQATALLDLFTDTLKGLVPASGGGTANYLRADGTWAPPASAVLQVLQTVYTANVALTTALPIDDTVPLITEGAEVLALAITPSSASNNILCEVDLWGSGNSFPLAAALFRGSTCINANEWVFVGVAQAESGSMCILDSPASTSAQTYSVRVGTSAGNACRLNGHGTGRLFGGAGKCTLTLTEIAG